MRTQQTVCAYCGLDLVHLFEPRLLRSVDHLVPQGAAKAAGIRVDYDDDIANQLIACQGCNGFLNWYVPVLSIDGDRSVEEFIRLRDRIFSERRELFAKRRERERELFVSAPWVALRESIAD